MTGYILRFNTDLGTAETVSVLKFILCNGVHSIPFEASIFFFSDLKDQDLIKCKWLLSQNCFLQKNVSDVEVERNIEERKAFAHSQQFQLRKEKEMWKLPRDKLFDKKNCSKTECSTKTILRTFNLSNTFSET